MLKILIVDDELPIRRSIASFLEDNGFLALTAENAKVAENIVKEEEPDFAIIDLNLPDIKGDQLILKLHEYNQKMKFIIHTGSIYYDIPGNLRAIGIKKESVILKPISDMNLILNLVNKTEFEEKGHA